MRTAPWIGRRTCTPSSSRSTTARRSSARRSTASSRSSRAPGCATRSSWSTTAAPTAAGTVISELARTTPHVVALNLLQNYGQHHANLAGFTRGDRRLRHHDGRRPAEPAGPGAAAHRRGDEGPRRRLRQVRAQAGRGLPPARQQADQHDQPAGLRPARRPGRVQLPDPAPRRRRPDLRVAHRAPLHHRPGAAVLQQPRPT